MNYFLIEGENRAILRTGRAGAPRSTDFCDFEAPPRTESLSTRLSEAFLGTLDVQDDAHTESQPLNRKTLFWKIRDQIARARISADFGRVADDDNPSRHPSRGSDSVSGCRGAGLPSLVGGCGQGAEREGG